MEPELSSYTRKKLERPYMLHGFDNVDRFVRLLKKNGIRIRERDLEEYEREGWLQPAFRLVLPEDLREGSLYLGMDTIQRFYADGHVELPQEGDYEPWSSFKSDSKSVKHDKKLLYYHPYQILQVKNILHYKSIPFLCRDSYTRSDIEEVINYMEADRALRNSQFCTAQLKTARDIGMLMLVEESYGIHVYHSISIPITVSTEHFMDRWREWKNGFTAGDLLKDCSASTGQVRSLRDWVVSNTRLFDPLREWHDLIRIMRPQALEKIKGDARTARMYHDIAGILTWFLHDLDGKDGEPDMPFDETDAEWKKDVYSDPFDYRTHKTKQAIVRRFIRDTSTRLYLLVEGETEVKVIEKICERRGISLADDAVMVLDRKGVTNMFEGSIHWLIRSARKDSIAIYIIADNEAKWEEALRKIRQEFNGPFDYHIWRTSFEEDNFGRANMVALINSYLGGHEQSLSEGEVSARQQRSRKGLVAAIEDAYGAKYENGLLRVIGKGKADLALELMNRAYQNTSNGDVDKLEIEKVLDKALGMVTVWT